MVDISLIPPHQPVLIAGPTASGKSALAIKIAQHSGGIIINADALQVFDGWRILTARPDDQELSQAPHHLYGHIPYDQTYSVGHWLRDVSPFLKQDTPRPIIVGGTGLYFQALTKGLAEIPPTSPDIRAEADARRLSEGHQGMLSELDPETVSRIDGQNPMRVQRAWEVFRATSKGLAMWQDETPPPLLQGDHCAKIVMTADKDWLNNRIDRRFDSMIAAGAMEEAKSMLPNWDPTRQSSRAIGAPELVNYLIGYCTKAEAITAAKIASHQYAKRQRTWFRSKMAHWEPVMLP
ncbi:MAG: tRNA (adenosine(37)-N6)-dimethylallyltransferase MiaA [Pseudoruegeria sp.]